MNEGHKGQVILRGTNVYFGFLANFLGESVA